MIRVIFDILRDWLNHNKIFFETAAAILISVASVVVSVKSCQIADRQLLVREAENQPVFIIANDGNDLVIQNDGKPARTFSIELAAALVFSVAPDQTGRRLRDLRRWQRQIIPYIEGPSWPTGRTTGELDRMPIKPLYQELNAIMPHFKEIGKKFKSRFPYQDGDTEAVLRIKYIDIVGSEHTVFFEVRPIGGNPRLDDRYGNDLFTNLTKSKLFEFNISPEEQARTIWRELGGKDLSEAF